MALDRLFLPHGRERGVTIYRYHHPDGSEHGDPTIGLFVGTAAGLVTCRHVVVDKEEKYRVSLGFDFLRDDDFMDYDFAVNRRFGVAGPPLGFVPWQRIDDVEWITYRPENPLDFVIVEGRLEPAEISPFSRFLPKYREAHTLVAIGCSGGPILSRGHVIGLLSGRYNDGAICAATLTGAVTRLWLDSAGIRTTRLAY